MGSSGRDGIDSVRRDDTLGNTTTPLVKDTTLYCIEGVNTSIYFIAKILQVDLLLWLDRQGS